MPPKPPPSTLAQPASTSFPPQEPFLLQRTSVPEDDLPKSCFLASVWK